MVGELSFRCRTTGRDLCWPYLPEETVPIYSVLQTVLDRLERVVDPYSEAELDEAGAIMDSAVRVVNGAGYGFEVSFMPMDY